MMAHVAHCGDTLWRDPLEKPDDLGVSQGAHNKTLPVPCWSRKAWVVETLVRRTYSQMEEPVKALSWYKSQCQGSIPEIGEVKQFHWMPNLVHRLKEKRRLQRAYRQFRLQT